MKVVQFLALIIGVLQGGLAVAQPVSASCEDAVHAHVTFTHSLTEFSKKNIVTISESSVMHDSEKWFEAPMMALQKSATANFLKLKKLPLRKQKCSINYAAYLNISEKLLGYAGRSDLQILLNSQFNPELMRSPAAFKSALLSGQERIPSELRTSRRKIMIISQSLRDYQEAACLEKMTDGGDLKRLNDKEAAAIYTRFLNQYVRSGGKISSSVDYPLQDATENRVFFLARQSFQACPLKGISKIKILVPTNVTVHGDLGQSEVITENPSAWPVAAAVQYSDTRIDSYPELVVHNRILDAQEYLSDWAKDVRAKQIIAGP